MDIKKYEVLLAVLDKGSFIKACDDLGYTQSGITHMMNSLEKELGFQILLRDYKGVRLTLAGERILPEIRKLVEMNRHMENQFDMIRSDIKNRISVGCFPTIACAWMPKIMHAFMEKYPQVRIEPVEDGGFDTLENWLIDGSIDVAFIARREKQQYDWIDLKQDTHLVVFPKDHPFEKLDAVPVELLRNESLFMYGTAGGKDLILQDYFKNCGLHMIPRYTSNYDYTVLFYVEEYLGLGIIPKLLLDICLAEHPKLSARPLIPDAGRMLGMAVRDLQKSPLVVQHFVSCTQSLAAQGIL